MKIALLAVAMLGLTGCAGIIQTVFTNPTGKITIDRQEFIDTFAVVKVLYQRVYGQAQAACARHAREGTEDMMVAWNCQQLPIVHAEAKALAVKIEAKIAVPESQIDWKTIDKLLSALIALVPG